MDTSVDDVFVEEDDPVYSGQADSQGEPHGRGTLTFPSGDEFQGHFQHGNKHGRGTFNFSDGSVLSGHYMDDGLYGPGIYTNEDGSWLEGTYDDGELCGPAREYSSDGSLLFKGSYSHNKRVGLCWIYNPGGGVIVGHVDNHGAMTGVNIAYIYPDRSMALYGRFKDGEMIKTRPATICRERSNGVPKFDVNFEGPVYEGDVSTESVISQHPTLEDVYEKCRVYVKQSDIPGANEGLFLRIDEKAGRVVSFYNGVRLTHKQVDARDWEQNSNTITLDDDIVIDVPEESIPTESYCASLGHKVNHSFTPNSMYDYFVHPRFGHIKCIRTIKPVKKDDELTVFYGYDHHGDGEGDTRAPDWYLQQMPSHMMHRDVARKS